MRIYVVQPGDTLWAISNKYGVSITRITEVNRLNEIPYLVVGQALVIPTTEFSYIVKSGDTLWSISRRFGVPVSSIVSLNNISNPNLIYPGLRLRIPELPNKFGTIEVNGYIEPGRETTDVQTVRDVGKFLTYISPFSYQINEDGTIRPLNDSAILTAARQNGVAPMMVITNFRNGTFDSALIHTVLTNVSVQDTLIQNVINILQTKNYSALNIDFERIPPDDRNLYNDFLRRITGRMHALNYIVSTALAPKPYDIKVGEWHGAHDYKAHGEIVDFVIIMTYEWGWSGGQPMAVAPINEVKKVLDYAVSVIPVSKIMMGVPLYGYDWTLPIVTGRWARRVSPQAAVNLAAKYGVAISYDQTAQSPFFNYVDESGAQHVVWFEDARSVRAKYELASQYGLRGVSYWVLGLNFPQNWYVLDDMFVIKKI